MKISIATAILILLIAALIGIPDHKRLTVIRESHAKLAAAAENLGISVDLSHPEDPIRITKRERTTDKANSQQAVAELIALAKEIDAMHQKGGTQDELQEKRYVDFMDGMMSLDSIQLKNLIAALHTSGEIKDESQNLVSSAMMTLSEKYPQSALSLFTESSNHIEETNANASMISSALTKWATDEPMAALKWLREHSDKFSEFISERAKSGLISGTAIHDPQSAFKLINELGIKESSRVIYRIFRNAQAPEERTAAFNALREHLTTIKDETDRNKLSNYVMSSLANGLARAGFDASAKWINDSNLTPTELERFSESMNYQIKDGEHGQWIQWTSEKLPAEKVDQTIISIVGAWTRKDHRSVGKWLTTATDGPSKHAAIRSYAETIAEYEPETAANWALTLPPGKDRIKTLNTIYERWPGADADAREAFRQKHSLQ